MKFKRYRPCSLNEALMAPGTLDADKDVDIVGAVDITYADAINERRRRRQQMKDTFKKVIADTEEFVDDNHKREKEGKKTMKVENKVNEAVDFGNPLEMGRGACAPLALDYTSDINNYAKHINDPEEAPFVQRSLSHYRDMLSDRIQEVENFNTYWATRYPAMIEMMSAQIDLIDATLGSAPVSEAVEIEEPPVKKRTRGKNEKPAIQDLSSEDLWYAVYDELSATTDQEGEGKAVNKQMKARRGERYEHVYPHGDSDIIVYATSPDELEFAKRVAEHYGVVAEEPKLDTNKTTNNFYKYSMIIRIPEDELYTTDIDDVM